MKTPLCSLLLCLATLPAALSAANAAPRIEIVGGEVVDIGRGRPGRVVRELAIANAGDDTLRILAVGSGCGCLVGEPDRRALGPGDTAHLMLTIETTGQLAEQWQKALSITTNDPHRPVVDVTVRASFRHDLRLRTMINTVHREPCTGGCDWTIEVENIADAPITVQPPIAEELRGLTATFDLTAPRTLVPGEVLRIETRIAIVGGEEFPSARVLLLSSSDFDSELRAMWFHAPDSR